jgi:TonB family protein
MAERVDILDQHDPLRSGFVWAVVLHFGLVAAFIAGGYWLHRNREAFGAPNPGGGAYSVSAVNKIPIPKKEAPQNPVAADTQSTVRSAPAKQEAEKKVPVPDKDAFQIPDRKKKQAERPLQQQKYMQQAPQNQIYSRSRTAVSNPMYGAAGSGQVGVGIDSPLGTRFPVYAGLVSKAIRDAWNTGGLSASSERSPAVVGFTISRDRTVRDVRLIQTSGNPNIDNSALRAVYQAQMPPFLPGMNDSSITAQYNFDLR